MTDGPTVVRRARAPQLEVERVRSRLAAKLYGIQAPPPTIAHYEIVERIGFGAQGDVYLVHDPRLDRRLAIKVLRRAVADGDVTEARALAQVVHPNVVPVFDVGVLPAEGAEPARAYLVMEYVAGAPLHAWCEATPSWKECLRVLLEAGRGLHAAHAAGIVHGDFKPSNVVVGDDGRPRVMDFGLARWMAEATTAESTGAYRGTPGYRAPECDDHGPDARSDQFSFCVTARQLLLATSAMPPRRIAARVDAVLDRGLRATPAERWPDMAAVVAALADAGRERTHVVPLVVAGAIAVVGIAALARPSEPPTTAVATPLEFRGAIAAELMRLGIATWTADRDEEARSLLERAVHLAESAGNDRVTAKAAIHLLDLAGRRRIRFDEARQWEPHARAAVARLGDAELEAYLDLRWGMILALAGESERGRDVLLDLHTRVAAAPPMESVPIAEVESTLSRLETESKHTAEALRWAERSVASHAATVGREHPAYARALVRLGMAQEKRDELVAARRSFEDALAYYDRTGDRTRGLGPRNGLAVVLERQGDLEGAARRYAEVLRDSTEAGLDDGIVSVRVNLGLLELARKDPDAALEHVSIARTLAESIYPADHPIFAALLSVRSEALRLTGEAARALVAGEQALAIAIAAGMDHGQLGGHRWRVGRVRWEAGDRTQARAEVAQACVELAIDPTPHDQNLADCEAWLRAHDE